MYFLDEVKDIDNDINAITNDNITFTSQNSYQYNSTTKIIYLIKKTGETIDNQIAIAENIEECKFEKYNEDEKIIIKVTMKILGEEKVTEYVMGYGNKYNDYQQESDYTNT